MMTEQRMPTSKRRVYALAALSACALWLCGARQAGAQWTTDSNAHTTTTTDKVGVGTSAPAAKLDVAGPYAAPAYFGNGQLVVRSTDAAAANKGGTIELGGFYFNTSNYSMFAALKGGYEGGTNAGYLSLFTEPDQGELTERVRVTSAGNVGIGTTAPGAPLEVNGNTSGGNQILRMTNSNTSADARILFGMYYGGGEVGDWGVEGNGATAAVTDMYFRLFQAKPILFYTSNTERLRIDGAGNVGIGTANPAYGKLQVNKSVRIDDDSASASGSDTITGAPNLYIGTTVGGNLFQYNSGGGLDLWQYNGGWGRTVTFSKNGSVGIGTTSPDSNYKLDVNGSVNVSGNISAKYQDVAEWVPSSQKLQAGTVVVLDTTQTNHVLASTKPYDTGVAGVVSASPGVILGQGGADKVKVATTGRVKVRADATRAPIHVGDLLVTSGVEGVAMKSIPVDLGGTQIHRPGTIIGKALEPLEKGTGEILVLLSLQ